jgi:hypothetical protein
MIPVRTELVDGAQTLGEQQNALQFMEQSLFAKVVSYSQKAGASTPANEAKLQDVPIGSQPPALSLVALAAGSDPSATITQQEQQGKSLVCQGDAFVSSQLQLVLVFR